MSDYGGSVEVRDAVLEHARITGERGQAIENQFGLLVQVAERIAIALERLAEQGDRPTP